ncbi:carboxymuconolactone decarboxylase family protein [Sphingomonas flavescens]|uniref:carboxymuconolactone decarboxylase family protein n=1 Tax=Sphingomonas flavescens TaxID=3132797 RepID=UPI0028061486|nr:carboxymuconolactone decarboxylase family protein [Sphingomonas limnosediminicola]
MTDRYRRGVEIVQRLAPGTLEKFCAGRVAELAPDFARMAIEFPFGDLYAREEIDLVTREVVAISALATLGHIEQLRTHIAAGLQLGLSRRAVVEILMQSAVYAGFPQALNALADCHDLLTDVDCVGGSCSG